MSWLDKLLGRNKREEDEVTPEEHERHLEQSANPGTAPVVPLDTTDEDSVDELGEPRAQGDDSVTPEPPRSH
jgi:hypothetical protein